MTWGAFHNKDVSAEQVDAYAAALTALHAFKDAFAEAVPDASTMDELTADLDRWTKALTPFAQSEPNRLVGRVPSLPARGHAAIPPFTIDVSDPERFVATLAFGSYFLGGGGAAHGGTIMTVLDEVMGVLATSGDRGLARTAYLTVNFRAMVPIGMPVRVDVWADREEGRKRFLKAELWNGETLCAEADALFVSVSAAAFSA